MKRFYYRFEQRDELSKRPGWRIYDREFLTTEGETIPLVVCRNKRIAVLVCNSLNEVSNAKP